jgi:hypothetical protein
VRDLLPGQVAAAIHKPPAQWLQVPQWPPPHEPQPPLVPLTRSVAPPLDLLMAEKSDSAREVALEPHAVHAMGRSAWLIERSFEKSVWHSAHRYSYKGMEQLSSSQ